jgi:hypothetical protein
MKYFKPELLARCRSPVDDTADAAAKEWERAILAYRKRLQAIRPALPGSVRRLLSRVTLHDAKVLAITAGPERQPWFTLLVRLEGTASSPGELLELTYLCVTGPHGGVAFKKQAPFKKNSPGLGWVLYDEFDFHKKRNFFTHSLLLTGGHEVEIRFRNLRVRCLDEVLLPPHELPEGERTWPRVGA